MTGCLPGILVAGGKAMKKEEKQKPRQVPWEVADPKLPVIRSGHMEDRVQH